MNENEAKKKIGSLDKELENFDRIYEEGRWLKNQGLLTASHQSELEGRRAKIYLNPQFQDIVEEYLNTTSNTEFRRLLLVLDRAIRLAKVESNQEVYAIRSRIEQAIGSYEISIGGKKAVRNEVRQILRFADDPKLRLAAFHCFDELSRSVEKDVKEMVVQRNSIARQMGYSHFGELGLALQGLSRDQLKEWFTAIVGSTASIYQSYLEDSARRLNQPALHLQDLAYTFYKFNSLPDEYFPSKKLSEAIFWLGERIRITEALARVRIDHADIPFQGICVTIHVPDDIRILVDTAESQADYGLFFHEVGHAMHSSYIYQPYHLFRDEPGPFCEGMAQTMARFADDPEFLVSFANVPEPLLRTNSRMWRASNIYHMLTLITQAEFEWQMYSNPETDLLDAWRTIQSEYLRVPAQDSLAWANNMYWASYPFYIQNYLVAEMIASQTHHTLNKTFGHSIHADAGDWLGRNYWNPGGSVEWSEKIANATGAELSTDQLILELVKGYPAE